MMGKNDAKKNEKTCANDYTQILTNSRQKTKKRGLHHCNPLL